MNEPPMNAHTRFSPVMCPRGAERVTGGEVETM